MTDNNNRSRFIPLIWVGVVIVLAVAAYFMIWHGKESERRDIKTSLIWGGPKNIAMIPIIAEKKGYFEEAGVNVKANYLQTGKIAMDAVVSGDIDIGVIVETNIAFVGFQEGADISVIASIAEKYDDAIVARRDQGIEKPKDLEGKELAILTGTTSHRFADLFVEFYGLDRSKIEFVNLSPPSIQASIIQGKIIAGSVWQPYRFNVARELGDDKVVQFNDKQIYKAYSLLAVRRGLLRDNAESVKKFLAALINAENFIKNNEDEAIAILSEELSVDKNILATYWDEYILSVKIEESLVDIFLDEGRWIQRTQKGFNSKPLPTYEHVVDVSLIREIDSARVIPAGK